MVQLEECSIENELVKVSLNMLGLQMRIFEVHKEMEKWTQRAASNEHDA